MKSFCYRPVRSPATFHSASWRTSRSCFGIQLISRRDITTRLGPTISTFHPTRLKATDFVDLSGLASVSIGTSFGRVDINTNWPDGTHGFFYYHRPTFAPPLAGQIRFRITPSADPTTFSSGKDLTTLQMLPWARTLPQIARGPRPFLALLRQDTLVSEPTLRCATRIDPLFKLLYAFKQPFLVDFQERKRRLEIVANELGRDIAEPVLLYLAKRVFTALGQAPFPFAGTALCCFELIGKNLVVIRILKIVQPVRAVRARLDNERNYIEPTEGALLTDNGSPWHYVIRNEAVPSTLDIRQPLRLLKIIPDVEYHMF